MISVTREFDDIDWCGFGGAEHFPGGGEPLIREFGDCVVVVSRSGAEVVKSGFYGEPYMGMPIVFPNQLAARCFLDGLPALFRADDAAKYGFQSI